MGDLLRGRPERQEARKNLSRAFDEKLVVAAILREQSLRKRQCFRAVLDLIARTPIGHPRVQRVEYSVSSLRPVELRCELQSRVVHNGRFATVCDLLKQLTYERRLAGSSVAH